MNEKKVLTNKELADYIRINEKDSLRYTKSGDLALCAQSNYYLTSVDQYLQNQIYQASNEDLDSILSTKSNLVPFSQLTDEVLINFQLRAENKKQVISQLAKMAYLANLTPSYEGLYIALEEREKLMSTALEQGVAIPHPRFPSHQLFKKPNIIMVKVNLGVDFDAPDGHRTYLFFMPCAPTQFIHIRLLAKISKLLHVPNLIERLKNTSKREDVMIILKSLDQSHLLPNTDIKSVVK